MVAQDGSGKFRTVQEAFNAVPDFRKKVTTIFIKKGIYKEKLILAGSKNMVRLIGEDRDLTMLTYDDYNQKKNIFGEDKGTSGSASCYLYGSDFSAENLTFQNSSGPVGQAVAVWVDGDKAAFVELPVSGVSGYALHVWARQPAVLQALLHRRHGRFYFWLQHGVVRGLRYFLQEKRVRHGGQYARHGRGSATCSAVAASGATRRPAASDWAGPGGPTPKPCT